MDVDQFSDKLKLVLKALVLSRTGLASQINVDKSLVGRWAAGTVHPSEHNLAKVTRFVAEQVPGFTLLDWDRDIDGLKQRLGVARNKPKSGAVVPDIGSLLPHATIEEAKSATKKRGKAYTGLWKSTRASHDMPGRFIHDICLTELRDDGMLRFRLGVEGVRYEGWSLLMQNQIFSVAWDLETSAMLFSIFNGIARHRPEMLDGITLATLMDAGGSPVASANVLTRIGDLTGDSQADTEMFEKAIADLNPLAPEGSVPDHIVKHLHRDVMDGPPGIMRLLFSRSIARGALLGDK